MTTLSTALALGVVHGLVGVAVSIVAAATRTLHLAIGPILVAGVLVQLTLVAMGAPMLLAAAGGIAVGAGLSALLGPLVLRPLRDRLAVLVGLAVAAAIIEAALTRTLGTRTFRPTALLPGIDPIAAALLLGLPLAVALAVLVTRTRWGRRLRLVGGEPAAAARAGVSPDRTVAGALAASGAVAVFAGLLVAPVAFVGVGLGAALTVRGVAAAALLGRLTPLRALAGGFAVGAVEALALAVAPDVGPDLAVALLVVIVLAVRGSEEQQAWGRPW